MGWIADKAKLKHHRVMQTKAVVSALIVTAALAATPAIAAWTGTSGRCPTCIGAAISKRALPVKIANNALVYYVVGEFASAPSMWIIDLDQGTISQVPFQDRSLSNIETRPIEEASLAAIRSAARAAWQRRTWPKPTLPPGTAFALDVYSDNRMVSLDPFDPGSKALVSAIEAAGARTSGSFAIIR